MTGIGSSPSGEQRSKIGNPWRAKYGYDGRMANIAGCLSAMSRCEMNWETLSNGMELVSTSKIASGRKPYSTERSGFLKWWRRESRLPKYLTPYADSLRNKLATS